jgi:hypothetical protein
MVNNSTNINKITSDFNPLNDGQQFHNSEVVFVDIGCGIVDHHSMSLGER